MFFCRILRNSEYLTKENMYRESYINLHLSQQNCHIFIRIVWNGICCEGLCCFELRMASALRKKGTQIFTGSLPIKDNRTTTILYLMLLPLVTSVCC